MNKKIIIVLAFLLLLTASSYAQFYRDPFESLLPREEEIGSDGVSNAEVVAPDITIEGVMWGADQPRVIIDSGVYKIGDVIAGTSAKVFKINKNIVFISFNERIFEMSVKNKGGI